MDKFDAYTRLFSLRDENRPDAEYYMKMMTKANGSEVPDEVIRYISESDSESEGYGEAEEYPDDGYNDGLIDGTGDDLGVPTGPGVVVNDEPDSQDDDGTMDLSEEPGDEDEESPDPDEIVSDFIEHVRKTPVYRKVMNSDVPETLCKSVSSFCTRYLIELHSSPYSPDDVRDAILPRIDVGELFVLLADYVDDDDLDCLARAVVLIRNFFADNIAGKEGPEPVPDVEEAE